MRKQLIGALCAASLAVCGAALAAPTLVGTKTNASGIDGVVVDSVTSLGTPSRFGPQRTATNDYELLGRTCLLPR
jgi:hypothetical protein